MVADTYQPTSYQLWTQGTDESISQMLWTRQTICLLLEFTASESVAVRVLSKLILGFLTVVLTDEQISSTFHHCSEDEVELAFTSSPDHTNGLILNREELSTFSEHLKLCCIYPNVAVNGISPSAFLKALCNLSDSSIVCCSCAQALLLQNLEFDSEIAFHMERVLKLFLKFGTRHMRTTACTLLWNLVETPLLEIETAESIIHQFTHESEELAKCILGCTQVASSEGKYNYIIRV